MSDQLRTNKKKDRVDPSKVRRKVDRTILRQYFSHHPNCDQYNHHVIRFGTWRLCLGCTATYLSFLIIFPLDLIVLNLDQLLSLTERFILGLTLFVPAVIQIFWKSKRKRIKFLMRFSLGISVWFLLSSVALIGNLLYQILGIGVFIAIWFLYRRISQKNNLYECRSCDYDQKYDTCLIKYREFLKINGLDEVENEYTIVQNIIDLKRRAKFDKSIELPVID